MLIQSTRFGQLDIPDEELIHFSHALPGFPEEKTFALLPYGQESPFAFLQSAADPDLTFLIVEPFSFFNDYQFELDDNFASNFGFDKDASIQVFNIVTVPDKLEEMTVNLLAPIVVNNKSRCAVQVILEKTAYTTRHRLFPQGFPPQVLKEAK